MDNTGTQKISTIFEEGYFLGEQSIEMYYRKYEVEESKATIVISHGFCESIEKYKELIKTFNQNNFSVYALDHRGHGKSGRLGIDNSQINVEKFEYYLKDFKTFLNSVVIPESSSDKLFLFAHSMGGAVGAMFLENYNDYFDCAILNCPMMEIETGKYPKIVSKIVSNIACIIRQGNKYLIGHGPFEGKPDLISSGTSSEKRYNTYFNKQLQYEYLQTSGGSFNWLKESLKATNYITKASNVQNVIIPVLLFQSGKDTFVKSKGQNKFVSYAPNCKLVLIEEAKHEIYIERDEILNPYLEQVLEFYNQNVNTNSSYK